MARKKISPKSVKSKATTSLTQKGMPPEKSIEDVVDFVSPQGVPYKILKTTQTDAYDPPLVALKKPKKS